MAGEYSCFTYEVDDKGIGHLRFNRADALNAFDEAQHAEFADFMRYAATADLRALILSGEGRAFSAGGDFDFIIRQNEDKALRDRVAAEAAKIFEMLIALPYPVIAAVHGAAVGLGATIATLCDIVIVCEKTKIADPHVHLGLVAGDGGVISWSQSIGVTRAKRYLLTGDRIDGRTAYEIGLASDLVETPEQVLPLAKELAGKIAALPVGGVNGTKRAFAEVTKLVAAPSFQLGLDLEMDELGGPAVRAVVDGMMSKAK